MDPNSAVLSLDRISKSFGGLQVLADIDLTLEEEEIVGLIGPGTYRSQWCGKVNALQCHYVAL
jgi:ABC-type branched-subunit amino acid transport system ATPase component